MPIVYNTNMFEHDALDIALRRPQGAVRCQDMITIGGRIFGEEGLQAFLCLRFDDGREQLLPMSGGRELVQASFRAPETPGLVYYCFKLQSGGHVQWYGGETGKGHYSPEMGACWQLTVYQRDFETPDWFKNSVCYQIFPDRFHRSHMSPWREGADYHRSMGRKVRLHENWGEEPDYLPAPGEEFYAPNDYFGGDLRGIEEKLPYLRELGVSCLYLNPIFEADSNHRYNTADYLRIDPMLGTEADFARLCKKAEEQGIRIILDGVFSHTGADSRYFDKKGTYGRGAYASKSSPYYPWYRFRHHPDSYECWWNFDTLPNVEETEPSYGAFIHGEKGVISHWLEQGAYGWRLDVADELPDGFIRDIRNRMKTGNPEYVLLGEVWEDCSNKQGPQGRRGYVNGDELDSAMDYPLRKAVLGFLAEEMDAYQASESLWRLFSHYPKPFYEACLHLLSSHDEVRALSYLSGAPNRFAASREEQIAFVPTQAMLERGKRRLLSATALQMLLPGVPCIYYGDEAGLWGMGDPFNRRTYPWGRADEGLLEDFKKLIALRNTEKVLHGGHMRLGALSKNVLCLVRYTEKEVLLLAINGGNRGAEAIFYPGLLYQGGDGDVPVPLEGIYRELQTGLRQRVFSSLRMDLEPGTYKIWKKEQE